MNAQEAMDYITKAFDAGRNVLVCTAYKATRYAPKHRNMFSLGESGLYVARGRGKDCLAYPSRLLVDLRIE